MADTPDTFATALNQAETSLSSAEDSHSSTSTGTTTDATAQPSASTTPAAATTPQADADLTDAEIQQYAKHGIPVDRHKAILERQRRERQELEARYSWAKPWQDTDAEAFGMLQKLAPGDFRQLVSIVQAMHTDPIAFVQQFTTQLQQHPEHAPKLRSLAAKALQAARGANGNAAAGPPEPDIELQDGRRLYSAEQLAKREEWLQTQLLQKVNGTLSEQLSPLQANLKQQQQAAEAERLTLEARSWAKSTVGELSKLPHFDKVKGKVAEALLAAQRSGADNELAEAIAYKAYSNAIAADVLPTLGQTTAAQVHHELREKAAAGLSISPGDTAAPSSRSRPQSMAEALEQAYSRLG